MQDNIFMEFLGLLAATANKNSHITLAIDA